MLQNPFTARNLVQGEGWFKADIGPVQVVFMDAMGTDAQAQFLEVLRNDFDNLLPTARRGVLYEVTDRNRSSAAERKKVGELLNEKRGVLGKVTSSVVLVTPSLLARGYVTAVFWLAPPPYPFRAVATLSEGFPLLAKYQPSIDAQAVAKVYQELRADFRRR